MREWRVAISATGWIVQEMEFLRTAENPHVPYYYHREHHHHLGIIGLGHLLTRFTHLEVSSTVSPGSFCILVCSFFIIFGNLLLGILFTCCSCETCQHSITPIIRINLEGEPSGYAKKSDNWIFLWEQATLVVLFRLLLFTVCACV